MNNTDKFNTAHDANHPFCPGLQGIFLGQSSNGQYGKTHHQNGMFNPRHRPKTRILFFVVRYVLCGTSHFLSSQPQAYTPVNIAKDHKAKEA